MSDVLPFECEFEQDCAIHSKDPACANRDACLYCREQFERVEVA